MPATLYLITPLIALLASGLVIAVIRFLDVLERESWWAIGLCFVIGLMTVIPAIVICSISTIFWAALLGESAPLEMLQVTVDAPLFEEIVKGIGVAVALLLIRRQIDSLTDYIVYSAVVAIAFEFCENILYLWSRLSMPDGALLAWIGEINARTIGSAGMHALFTVWIGFALWCLIEGRGYLRWVGGLVGVVLAVLLHAINNIGAYFSNVGDPATISAVNQAGFTVGVIGNTIQMALFLALIGSAILQDLHLLSKYGLALQQRLLALPVDQQEVAMARLQAFLNPFHHLVAHSQSTWLLTPLSRTSPVARAEYGRFAKAALQASKQLKASKQGREMASALSDAGLGLLLMNCDPAQTDGEAAR
jgi:RsiW-degrading membrane proteinase PrsW (M82 family)